MQMSAVFLTKVVF